MPYRSTMSMEPAHAQSLSDEEKLARLRLIRSENVGPITFKQLLDRYGSGTAALEILPKLAQRGGRTRRIRIASEESSLEEIREADSLGASMLHLGDPAYPKLLTQIAYSPAILYVLGRIENLNKPCFGIVGGRNASIAGKSFARKTAAILGSNDLAIVSGLARGIDTAAHIGSLETGTVAVLAGGVDVVFPPENKDLHEDIRMKGAIVSEMPPGTKPLAQHFPRRNRIISGMSSAVLVIEAKRKSGSLITARFAAEQGRTVFAAPASPLEPRGQGCNDLIREGATLAQNADEILLDLAPSSLLNWNGPSDIVGKPETVEESDIDNARRSLLNALSTTPIAQDALIRDLAVPASSALSALLELELAGRINRHAGGTISLTPVS